MSHETPKFGAFALCILQLHNCRNLDAQPPTRPGEGLLGQSAPRRLLLHQ